MSRPQVAVAHLAPPHDDAPWRGEDTGRWPPSRWCAVAWIRHPVSGRLQSSPGRRGLGAYTGRVPPSRPTDVVLMSGGPPSVLADGSALERRAFGRLRTVDSGEPPAVWLAGSTKPAVAGSTQSATERRGHLVLCRVPPPQLACWLLPRHRFGRQPLCASWSAACLSRRWPPPSSFRRYACGLGIWGAWIWRVRARDVRPEGQYTGEPPARASLTGFLSLLLPCACRDCCRPPRVLIVSLPGGTRCSTAPADSVSICGAVQ